MRRRQEPVYLPCISAGAGIGQKSVDLGNGRRQADHIEGHPAEQGDLVGFCRGRQFLLREPRADEAVDLITRPTGVVDHRDRRKFGRNVGPMVRPFGPLRDPAANQFHLLRRRFFPRFERGHSFVRIVRRHPAKGLALLGLFGDEREMAAEIGKGARFRIQPQIGFPLLGIGAMTIEAISRQDRPHVSIEVNVSSQEEIARNG